MLFRSYTTTVCASCVAINEEDLLIIYNVTGNEGKDIEIIQPFQNINLEYDSLDTSFKILIRAKCCIYVDNIDTSKKNHC